MAVMGFGGGSIVGSPVAAALIKAVGPATCLGILSVVHFCIMITAAQVLRFPPKYDFSSTDHSHSGHHGGRDAAPVSVTMSEPSIDSIDDDRTKIAVSQDVTRPHLESTTAVSRQLTMKQAVRTVQFWLLWLMFFINITAGISILSQLSLMLQELFALSATRAAMYLSFVSMFNCAGRFLWATLSDQLGRRRTFALFFASQAGMFGIMTSLAKARLFGWFMLCLFMIFSMYGGGFATMPAFLADMFGARNVGAVHGVILTAWSMAGAVGPILITAIRDSYSRSTAASEPAQLYAVTLYVMSALLSLGFGLALLVKPLKL